MDRFKALFAVFCCIAPGGAMYAQANLSIDASVQAQTITGFGTAIVYSESNYSPAGNSAASANINQLFAPNGLNLSILRVANWNYGSKESEGNNMYNADAMTLFRAARAGLPNSVLMSSWSPPASLKNMNSVAGGTLRKVNNKFDYTGFANWWRQSLDSLVTTNGQSTRAPEYISIQNEPNESTSYQSCVFDSMLSQNNLNAVYGQAFEAVRAELNINNGGVTFANVAMVGPEPSRTWNTGAGDVQDYLNAPAFSGVQGGNGLSDVNVIGFHLYGDNVDETGNGRNEINTLENTYPEYNGYKKWVTEYNGDQDIAAIPPSPGNPGTPGYDPYPGANPYLAFAATYHYALTVAEVQAYLVWNARDLTGSDHGGLYDANGNQEPKYWALGHYSKWVQPGDVRIGAASSDSSVLVSAYVDKSTSPNRVVLVLINTGGGTNNVSLSFKNITSQNWTYYQTYVDGNSVLHTFTQGPSNSGTPTGVTLWGHALMTIVIN